MDLNVIIIVQISPSCFMKVSALRSLIIALAVLSIYPEFSIAAENFDTIISTTNLRCDGSENYWNVELRQDDMDRFGHPRNVESSIILWDTYLVIFKSSQPSAIFGTKPLSEAPVEYQDNDVITRISSIRRLPNMIKGSKRDLLAVFFDRFHYKVQDITTDGILNTILDVSVENYDELLLFDCDDDNILDLVISYGNLATYDSEVDDKIPLPIIIQDKTINVRQLPPSVNLSSTYVVFRMMQQDDNDSIGVSFDCIELEDVV